MRLELLRTKQRVDQVDKQTQRRDSSNDVVHVVLLRLQLVAGLGEGPANQQNSTADSDIEQVKHLAYSVSIKITLWPACRKRRASSLSVVGHHFLHPPITTGEPGLNVCNNISIRSRHK